MCGRWHAGCLSSSFLNLLLPPSLCLLLLLLLLLLFYFPRGKGFLIPGMPEKGPLRITLAKPLSLQEIHCLLKKVVGVENQGEVLFFLSFSLFPWKVITGFEEKSFFWHSSFLVTAFHISPLFFFFSSGWWNFRSGKCEGRCLRERERRFREGCAHWEAMLNIQGKCLLF